MKDVAQALADLVVRLKRRVVLGSYNSAVETLQLLRTAVSHGKWSTVESLLDLMRDIGAKLTAAQATEFSTGNIVRRAMHAIREEYAVLVKEGMDGATSGQDADDAEYDRAAAKAERVSSATMYQLLGGGQEKDERALDTALFKTHQLKPHFIQVVNELMDEVEGIYTNIANQALDHIHSNEIIMTTGRSKTIEEFLKAAHRKRKFQVIVAEAAPLYSGHDLALSLSKAGIETTVISDSAIYAVMSRVNKVILGTHAVLANGGLIAVSGSNNLASAARYHHVPVAVCTGLYKLSPLQPFDDDIYNLCVCPDSVVHFENDGTEFTEVVNPFFDYVSPEHIDIFVTNVGGHTPAYIYRLLSENYDQRDQSLKAAPIGK